MHSFGSPPPPPKPKLTLDACINALYQAVMSRMIMWFDPVQSSDGLSADWTYGRRRLTVHVYGQSEMWSKSDEGKAWTTMDEYHVMWNWLMGA